MYEYTILDSSFYFVCNLDFGFLNLFELMALG